MIGIDTKPVWNAHYEKGKLVQSITPFDDLPYEEKASWYSNICSEEEIVRMLDMRNGDDYLLRLKADTIIDNMRLYRVVLKKAQMARFSGCPWSLEQYFQPYGYKEYINSLQQELKEKVSNISYSNILSNDLNGFIFESPFGICTTLSYAINDFIKYSALALLNFEDEVPDSVRLASLRIAVRTMLGKEALDFELDPRGIIPDNIDEMINHPISYICTFVGGHEISHYLNGDIKKGNTKLMSLNKVHFKDDEDYRKIYVYNTSQKHEFAADLGALRFPVMTQEKYALYYNYTLLWFSMLAIYEAVEDYMTPPIGYQSHPGAKARYKNIIENAEKPYYFAEYEKYYLEDLPKVVDFWSDVLKDDVSEHFEYYEMYGSVYLAAPNTKWRGRELVDRKDY